MHILTKHLLLQTNKQRRWTGYGLTQRFEGLNGQMVQAWEHPETDGQMLPNASSVFRKQVWLV